MRLRRSVCLLVAVAVALAACGGDSPVEPASDEQEARIRDVIAQYGGRASAKDLCEVITVGMEFAIAGSGVASDSTALSTPQCPKNVAAGVRTGAFTLDPLDYDVGEIFILEERALAQTVLGGETRILLLYGDGVTWLVHAEIPGDDPLPSYFEEFNDVM